VRVTKASLKSVLDSEIAEMLTGQPALGYRQVAKRYGCSAEYVVKVAKQCGIVRRRGRKPGIRNHEKRGA
jgi:hypothetical protein